MRRLLLVLLFIVLAPVCSRAGDGKEERPAEKSHDGVKVIEAEGKSPIGEYRTKDEARTEALKNAQRSALEEAVGTTLHGSTTLYNGDIISDLIKTSSKGLIVGKTILEDKCDADACFVRIKATVKPLKSDRPRTVNVLRASVQRPGEAPFASSPVFLNNNELQIKVTLNEDAYLNIFSIDQYGKVNKLLPNEYVKPEPVLARKEFIFPDDALRTRGLKLRVTTLKGHPRSIESVLIIATKEEGHFLEDASMENPKIEDLMKELSDLDPSLWVEKVIGYEVRK